MTKSLVFKAEKGFLVWQLFLKRSWILSKDKKNKKNLTSGNISTII
jgi:hypothetical protein